MTALKRFLMLAAIAVVCISLTACGSFNGYDEDSAIINARTSSMIGGSEITVHNSKYTLTAAKFNGVKKLKKVRVCENPDFDFSLNVEGGKFKIVLVKDGVVITIAEFVDGVEQEFDRSEIAAGRYSVRIVGEDATGVTLEFNYPTP